LTKSLKILMEFLDSVVDRNLSFRQQGLERKLAQFREAACLREGKPLLLEQSQGKLLFDLRLTEAGCGENLVWNGD
jgi:hypothetical protein